MELAKLPIKNDGPVVPLTGSTSDHWRRPADQVPRPRPGPHGLHLRPRRLQPRPPAEARGKNRMIEATAAATSTVTKSTRIRGRSHTVITSLRRSPYGNLTTPHPSHKTGSPTPISAAC